jgi:hypothetical protein
MDGEPTTPQAGEARYPIKEDPRGHQEAVSDKGVLITFVGDYFISSLSIN